MRLAWTSDEVALESIVSGKTGGCPEDCSFCSQSAVFDTPVRPQPLLTRQEVLQAARSAQDEGATEFCIVYAVRGPDERLMGNILDLTAIHEARSLFEAGEVDLSDGAAPGHGLDDLVGLTRGQIDGALVGGASLKADDFWAIYEAGLAKPG